jgi:hypothetical protein
MGPVDRHRHFLLDRHIHRVKRHPHLQLCTQHQRRNLHFVVHVRTYLFTLLLLELEDEVQLSAQDHAYGVELRDCCYDAFLNDWR